MSKAVKVALILAIGLIAAAFLNGGIYQIVTARQGDGAVAYRLNRLTGEVTAVFYCVIFPSDPRFPGVHHPRTPRRHHHSESMATTAEELRSCKTENRSRLKVLLTLMLF
jgi:hypothetical protein